MTTDLLVMRYQLSLAEAAQSQLRAQYYARRIDTHQYRERLGRAWRGGLPEHGGVLMTEADLCADEVNTMDRHISLAEQHLDYAKDILTEYTCKQSIKG